MQDIKIVWIANYNGFNGSIFFETDRNHPIHSGLFNRGTILKTVASEVLQIVDLLLEKLQFQNKLGFPEPARSGFQCRVCLRYLMDEIA